MKTARNKNINVESGKSVTKSDLLEVIIKHDTKKKERHTKNMKIVCTLCGCTVCVYIRYVAGQLFSLRTMATKRKISPLWNHFEEVVPGKKAKCGYCSRVLAISSSSIGSLSRHIKAIHPTIAINSSRQSATVATAPERRGDNSDIDAESGPSSSANAAQVETTISELSALSVPMRLTNKPSLPTPPAITDYIQTKKTLPRHRMQQLDEQLVRMIANQ